MQQFSNEYGIAFSAEKQSSVTQFSELVRAYLGMRTDTMAILKQLLKDEPLMPMARCMKGYFGKLMGSAEHANKAQKLSAELNAYAEENPVNRHEQQHITALSTWCQGDLEQTVKHWENILQDYPHDTLALRLAHFNHFYSGDGKKIRDSIVRVLPRWSASQPDYGFILGMYAFGLEESGDLADAEKHGRKAVDMNSEDGWAIHAVAHVMETSGRYEEGIQWLQELNPHWQKANNFRFHLYWHQCLYHLELGEYETVFDIHDQQIASDLESGFYLDLCNASSLLWRLELHGLDVGDRWQQLVEHAQPHTTNQDLVFVSLHYLMVLVAANQTEQAHQLLDNIQSWAQQNTTQGQIADRVGKTLANGIHHARQHNHQLAWQILHQARTMLYQIGGSQAQRDLFNMVMLHCAKQSNDQNAHVLFTERVKHKPQSRWSQQL